MSAPYMRKGASGWHLYVRVLAVLMRASCTAAHLADEFGIGRNAMRPLLRRMVGMKIIRVAGYLPIGARNFTAPVYGYGSAPSAPVPPTRKTGAPSSHQIATAGRIRPLSNMTGFAHLLRELAEPCTAAMLAENTGMGRSNLYPLLLRMKSLGICEVTAWEQPIGGGSPAAMYQFGLGLRAAPRPRPLSRQVISARANAKRTARAQQLRALKALAGTGHSQAQPCL